MECEECGAEEKLQETIFDNESKMLCERCISQNDAIVLKPAKKVKISMHEKLVLMPHFSEIIKKARRKALMSEEELAKAIAEPLEKIKQAEQDSLKDEGLAKKLEKFFHINLRTVEREIDFREGKITIGQLKKLKEGKAF